MDFESFARELVKTWNDMQAAEGRLKSNIRLELWGMCKAAHTLGLPNVPSASVIYFTIQDIVKSHGDRPRYSAMDPNPPKEWDERLAEELRERLAWRVAPSPDL